MRKIVVVAVIGALAVPIGLSSGGCGAGITPDMTISQALQSIAANPLLNQITVGDVVQAFQDFTASISQGHGTRLSSDQVKQLQDLQGQLDAGAITRDEFETQAEAIIGDAAPGFAFGGFGFFGSPFGHQFQGPLSGDLALSDEQQTQARDIFTKAHDDIQALVNTAHDNILNNVLTQEQRDKLAALQAAHPRLFPFADDKGGQGARGGRGPGGPGFGGPRGPGGFISPPVRENMEERLATELGLTAEQKTQIDQIRSDLREAIKARHDLAREEFRAILTADQLAALDAFEAKFPPPSNVKN